MWIALLCAGFLWPSPAAFCQDEENPDVDGAAPTEARASADSRPGATLLDGEVVVGRLLDLTEDGYRFEGREQPIPAYELREVRLGGGGGLATEVPFHKHPLLRLRGGEELAARVLDLPFQASDEPGAGTRHLARVRTIVDTVGELDIPLEQIAAFRLREASPRDTLFEDDLARGEPEADTIYLRRNGLFRFRRPFRGLSAEHVFVEDSGRQRSIQRQLVQGVTLAPVASRMREADPPSILEIPGVGRLPVHLVGFEKASDAEPHGARLLFRMSGQPAKTRQRIAVGSVRRILPASDRVLFLSDAEPTLVESAAVAGPAIPWRKDRSVSGDPLRLGERQYRRGLGVHSKTALEYRLGGEYASFAAVVGLDRSAQGKGSVTFRVLADGTELYKRDIAGRDAPEAISLPVTGVDTLRLEVDYGADQLDLLDHADWADARVTKDAAKKADAGVIAVPGSP